MKHKRGIAGNTRIYNPVDGSMHTVAELYTQKILPCVATLMGPIACRSIQKQGSAQLTEIITATGRRLHVSPSTCVLCTDHWEYVSNLEAGEYIGVGSNYLLANVGWEQIAAIVRVVTDECYTLTIPIAGHVCANWIWVTSD